MSGCSRTVAPTITADDGERLGERHRQVHRQVRQQGSAGTIYRLSERLDADEAFLPYDVRHGRVAHKGNYTRDRSAHFLR